MSCLLEKEMGDDFILIYPGQDGDEEYYESLNEVHSLHGYRPVVDDEDEEIEQLHGEVDRLQTKLASLKSENESLKKKQEDQKPLEEKIRSLKRRNAELAAMARRLEEKAKHLQQENLKKPKEIHHNEVDHMKRMFARQRARDLAEYAKNMLARDKEIEELRKKCQELAEQLGNQAIAVPENVQMYQEKEELENIIKQSAKERLLLERQVIKTKPDKLSEELRESRQRIHGLQELNRGLEDDIVQLRQELQHKHQLDQELHERTSDCENLSIQVDGLQHTLNTERLKVHDLEEELQSETVKNTELSSQVSELQDRLAELQKFEEDVQSLQKSLAESQYECASAKEQAAELQETVHKLESECSAAKEEATELQSEVDKLESLLKHLRECAEQHDQLESEHKAALSQLKHKQDEVTMLQKAQNEWKKQTEEELSESQSKLERLTAELDILSLELERNRTKCSSNSSIAIQTDHDDESSVFLSNGQLPSDSTDLQDDLIRSKSARLAESAKSLDTGFSEGDEDEYRSPLKEEIEDLELPLTPEIFHRESIAHELLVDPELSAISQRLREIEAADSPSEEEFTRTLSEADNTSFMSGNYSAFSNKSPYKMENGLIPPNSRMSGRKGPLQVYVAKYSYDPYQYSPNDNPDAELPLNAGDYILIHGDMDEDGFFEGELIDGRRGLVPSNFIEKVADEDLQEFHNAMAMASHHSDDGSYGNNLQHDLDFNSSDESEKVLADLQSAESTVAVKEETPNKANSEGRIAEEGDESLSLSITDNSMTETKPDTHTKKIPCPVKLKLDRQLTSSVVVSWSPPEGLKPSQVQAYHVYLDGEFKTSIRGTERTKALVENVDTSKIHRVSVRTVTSEGQSADAQCTMLFGKDAIPTPSKLEVSEISANSALLSWLPGNSSYHHVIYVNSQEVRRVKPGVCSHLLSGLAPSTLHKVSVQAKNLSSGVEASRRQQELLTASLEFTTLAGGIPDPPLDVQLEAGPQEGTLLLTWLPVTITPAGTSNGTAVAGYAVYADGKLLREVAGPTNDHAVLTGQDFQGVIPKVLTIRTIAGDKTESVDSNPVKVQHGLVRELSRGVTKVAGRGAAGERKQSEPTDTDEEIEAAFKEDDKVATINPHYREEVMETSSSELSDIQEVEEENLSESQDTEHNQHRSSPRGDKKAVTKHGRHTEDREKSPKSDGMLAPNRVVPHIQITRDSSSERGTSFEALDDDESAFHRPGARVSPEEPRPRKPSPSPVAELQGEKQDGYRDSPKGKRPSSGKSDASDSGRRSPGHRHRRDHGNRDHSDSLDQSGESVQELLSNDVVTKKKIRDDIPESELIDYEDNGEGDSMAEVGSDIYDEKRVRLFIALFDYDPVEMSPNVDAIDEELPFKEGQLIKVYGDKDADGFFRGSCNNRMGYVPCNMVSEVQVDDPEIAAQLLQESQSSNSAETWDDAPQEKTPTRGQSSNRLSPSPSPTMQQDTNLRKMVALYDYDPQELSPNVDAEVELCFKAGDIIMIFGEADEDGFYQGELNGIRGLVPSNFITPASPADDEVMDGTSVVSPCRSGDSLENNTAETTTNESDWPHKIPNVTMDSRTPLKTEKRRHDLTNDVSTNKQVSPEHFLNGTDDKKKRPKGIFAKGKNIFKKFSR